MKKRNKFWALTMALVLTGGSSNRMQKFLSQKLRHNPEFVTKIMEENPKGFVRVTEMLMEQEMNDDENA